MIGEDPAWKSLKDMGVTHVFVTCGGGSGYISDGISKLRWMVRIAAEYYEDAIKLKDYFSGKSTKFEVGARAKLAVKNSLMYKLCYAGFADVSPSDGHAKGWDRARLTVISDTIVLRRFTEVWTSENWLVRILLSIASEPENGLYSRFQIKNQFVVVF